MGKVKRVTGGDPKAWKYNGSKSSSIQAELIEIGIIESFVESQT